MGALACDIFRHKPNSKAVDTQTEFFHTVRCGTYTKGFSYMLECTKYVPHGKDSTLYYQEIILVDFELTTASFYCGLQVAWIKPLASSNTSNALALIRPVKTRAHFQPTSMDCMVHVQVQVPDSLVHVHLRNFLIMYSCIPTGHQCELFWNIAVPCQSE